MATPPSPAHILLVAADAHYARRLAGALEQAASPHALRHVRTLSEAGTVLRADPPALVMAALDLAQGAIGDLCSPATGRRACPVVVLAGEGDEERAAATLEQGIIDDLITSHQSIRETVRTIDRTLAVWRLREAKRHAEEALEQSKRRFRDLTEMLPQGFFAIAREGRLTDLNSAGYEILGLTPADLDAGANLEDFIDEAHKAHMRRRIEAVLAGDSGERAECRMVRKDGTAFAARVHLAPLRAVGGVIGLEGIIEDAPAVEPRERQRRQSQRMEALGVMAGGIAHDFNNILSAVLGYADISLTRIEPEAPVYRHLTRIREMSLRAIDIVKQILLFSRRDGAERQLFQLKLVVRDVHKMIRAAAPTTIEIALELNSDAYIHADPADIHQVVINLCNNAIHAMAASDGRLVLALSEAPDGDAPTGAPGWVRLSVSDTGAGIAPEHLGRIFDPHYSTKVGAAGAGLGLSAAREIVTQSGGEIQVESEPGRGSTFSLRFPKAVHRSVAETAVPLTADMPAGHERILFVDDEAYLVDIAKLTLSELGYTVTGTTDPRRALKLFTEDPQRFDLVITDMSMPRLKGDRLAARILELAPTMPLILCTGQTDTCDHLEHTLPQVGTILKKPVPVAHLSQVVRQTLDDAGQKASG